MSAAIRPGTTVRLKRRPFFRGLVEAVQNNPRAGAGGGGSARVRWLFKPAGWVSQVHWSLDDLEIIEAGDTLPEK
jgi:hypothetical protein